MNLPERFSLSYTDEYNEQVQPVMIHRALLGSFERFVAILTEHFAGEFPLFIAPTQVILIPIGEAQLEYTKTLRAKILNIGAYAEVLDKNESLSKKIRIAEKQKVPLIVVIGEKEVESKILAIRDRREKSQYELAEDDFITALKTKIGEVSF